MLTDTRASAHSLYEQLRAEASVEKPNMDMLAGCKSQLDVSLASLRVDVSRVANVSGRRGSPEGQSQGQGCGGPTPRRPGTRGAKAKGKAKAKAAAAPLQDGQAQ